MHMILPLLFLITFVIGRSRSSHISDFQSLPYSSTTPHTSHRICASGLQLSHRARNWRRIKMVSIQKISFATRQKLGSFPSQKASATELLSFVACLSDKPNTQCHCRDFVMTRMNGSRPEMPASMSCPSKRSHFTRRHQSRRTGQCASRLSCL